MFCDYSGKYIWNLKKCKEYSIVLFDHSTENGEFCYRTKKFDILKRYPFSKVVIISWTEFQQYDQTECVQSQTEMLIVGYQSCKKIDLNEYNTLENIISANNSMNKKENKHSKTLKLKKYSIVRSSDVLSKYSMKNSTIQKIENIKNGKLNLNPDNSCVEIKEEPVIMKTYNCADGYKEVKSLEICQLELKCFPKSKNINAQSDMNFKNNTDTKLTPLRSTEHISEKKKIKTVYDLSHRSFSHKEYEYNLKPDFDKMQKPFSSSIISSRKSTKFSPVIQRLNFKYSDDKKLIKLEDFKSKSNNIHSKKGKIVKN